MRTGVRSFAVSFAFALSAVVGIIAPAAQAGPAPGVAAEWPQFQGNPAHTGFNTTETTLNTGNVSGLRLQWIDGVFGTVDGSVARGRGRQRLHRERGRRAGSAAPGSTSSPKQGCRHATCAPTWRGKTAPNDAAAPAVVGGLAYMTSQASFTSNNGRLNVFDAAGCGADVCRPLWRGLGGKRAVRRLVAGGVRRRGVRRLVRRQAVRVRRRRVRHKNSAGPCGPARWATRSRARRQWPAGWCTWRRSTGRWPRSTPPDAAPRPATRSGPPTSVVAWTSLRRRSPAGGSSSAAATI